MHQGPLMTNQILSALHTALVDAREGYGKALEKAQDAELLTQLRAVDALHAAAHEDIHAALASRGAKADDDGSLMGAVHKTVISARSALIGLDEGALASFASGEEHTLKRYDEAIANEGDPRLRVALTHHRDALAEKVSEMKRQAERA